MPVSMLLLLFKFFKDIVHFFTHTMIVTIALIFATIVLFASFRRSTNKSMEEFPNRELDIYYENIGKDSREKRIQLLRGAKVCLNNCWNLADELETASGLHKYAIISDTYMNRLKHFEEELSVEKIIIQREAESISQGWEQTIFGEATKVPIEKKEKKVVLLDEKLYYKKKEILQKALSERILME